MGVNDRVKGHRIRQRAAGLRLVQLWLPDTRTPESRLKRGGRLLLRADPAEADTLKFMEHAADWESDVAR